MVNGWRSSLMISLPTDGRELIYAKNRGDPEEFWPALLEKAYAKLRGNYEALDGGKTQDAIVDMTGSISETIDLTEKSNIPDNLYDLVWKSYQMNSLMGASIHVPYKGNNIQLLRLRNPWGKSEWTGDWSDQISFLDVLRIFDEIQLCHLQPDSLTSEIANDEGKQNWEEKVYHDAWIRGLTAGGCGNPPDEVTRRFELDPGVYAIIPSTFKAHAEAKFMLRLYTEKPAVSGLLEEVDNNELQRTMKPLDPVKDLFMKRATEDGHIYAKELKIFLREMSASEFGEPILFSLEAARSLVTLMDVSFL
ncbi:CAPNN [Mytilus edulis]|uniref:CAPNN n=1 Tax=Mytilus edulis TaxID=6550 RepID=A0A8S3QMA3_MYTED|nr:CAPNN [Mytilus edulis]